MGAELTRRAGFRLLSGIRGGRVELVDSGRRFAFGPADAELRTRIEIHDPRAYRWALRGSTGLGEGYVEGLWSCDDLVSLLRIACRSLPPLDRLRARLQPLLRPAQEIGGLVPRNTRAGAARNISAHYDLGEPLFGAFLDPRLVYSCALFEGSETSLEDGQLAKLERVCTALDLGPDDHLLEIGTGWGGLAVHAAATRGCRVTTATISRHQHAYAVERVRAEGLADTVEVLLTDYRDLAGSYDKLVSIEMIEAVGWQYFPRFFGRCAELTRPGGAMFLQAIVIADDLYEQEKDARTFANKHVFPGGCLPSLKLIAELARASGIPWSAARTSLRTTPGPSSSGASASTGPGPSCGRSATTSVSRGCGTTTSPPRRRAFASGASATCSWCSRSRAGGRTATDGDRAHPHGKRRASPPDPRPRGVAANLGPRARAGRGRARRDRRRPAGVRRLARASRGRGADAGQPRRRDGRALRRARARRPHAAGNSLGAWVALELAKAGAAASVCAISPAGLWRRPLGPRRVDVRAWAARLGPLLPALLSSGRARAALLRSTVARPERLTAAEARALVGDWLSAPGYAAANREMRAHVFEHPELVAVPTTIAWGSEDRLVGPPKRERMPPGARYVVLEGLGHTPTWDDPPRIAELLLEASGGAQVGSGRSSPGQAPVAL